MSKPYLRDFKTMEKLSEYPKGTYFEAGHLVTKNAGWRNMRPEIDLEKCTGCGQCYLYCPDGVIFKEGDQVNIDYDFCKGCGVCAKICKFKAICMKKEATV